MVHLHMQTPMQTMSRGGWPEGSSIETSRARQSASVPTTHSGQSGRSGLAALPNRLCVVLRRRLLLLPLLLLLLTWAGGRETSSSRVCLSASASAFLSLSPSVSVSVCSASAPTLPHTPTERI
jgi:hypothetical protein